MNRIGTRELKTKRLILRQFIIEDAEDMYNNWTSDPEVTKYLTWKPHENIEETKVVLNDWISKYDSGCSFNWAIELKETSKVIGNIAIVKLDDLSDKADIGYCLCKDFWGQELMPEALIAVLNYLFDEVKLNRIAAWHDTNNPRSGRVMEKAGMFFEATLKGAGRNNQGICDESWYALNDFDR